MFPPLPPGFCFQRAWLVISFPSVFLFFYFLLLASSTHLCPPVEALRGRAGCGGTWLWPKLSPASFCWEEGAGGRPGAGGRTGPLSAVRGAQGAGPRLHTHPPARLRAERSSSAASAARAAGQGERLVLGIWLSCAPPPDSFQTCDPCPSLLENFQEDLLFYFFF